MRATRNDYAREAFVKVLFLASILFSHSASAQSQTYYNLGPFSLNIHYLYWNPFPQWTSHTTIAQAILVADQEIQKEFAYSAYQSCNYVRTQNNYPTTHRPTIWYPHPDLPPYVVRIEYTAADPQVCETKVAEIGGSWNSTIPNRVGEPVCDARADCGNPINFGTKNKFQRERDLGFDSLVFERTYNSALFGKLKASIGKGWTHTYARSLDGFFDATQDVGSAILQRQDGAVVYFSYENGVWKSANRPFDKLQPTIDAGGLVSEWMYVSSKSQEVERYDTHGRLTSIDDVAVNKHLNLQYVTNDTENPRDFWRVESVNDLRGRRLAFEYGANDQISKITSPDGGEYQYIYDASRYLKEIVFPNNTRKKYSYAEPGLAPDWSTDTLTGIVDETGSRYATFSYDDSEDPYRTEHAGGVDAFQIFYASNFTWVSITSPSGGSDVRQFSSVAGTKKTTSIARTCSGCVTQNNSYAFNTQGQLTSATAGNGATTGYSYSPNGQITQSVDASNDNSGNKRTIQTDWHASFSVPTEQRVYDALNVLVSKEAWTYNSRGQVLTASQIDPVTNTARITTTSYCEQSDVAVGSCPLLGLLTSVDGPRTDVIDTTLYAYYPSEDSACTTAPATCSHRKGDLWKVTNPLGQVTEVLKYDGSGRVLSVKDANGVVTDYEYHLRGWLTAIKVRGGDSATETDDLITHIEYWPTGLTKQVTLPDGSFTAYAYDAAHRLTDVVDGLGNTLHYVLDNAGNRIQEDTKDASGILRRTLSRVFNKLSQLQTQKDASNHETDFIYDANGNLDQVIDALGRVTDNDYDPLNRLRRTLQDVSGIAAGTEFEYNAVDNLTKVTDPKGLSTTYSYNGLGDMLTLDSPDTGVTSYTYDTAGNRKAQTDARGVTATYSYDALNRLTSIVYATDPSLNVIYQYDVPASACTTGETSAVGHVTQVSDGSGSTQYCYDRFGHLTRKVQSTNGQVFTLRYVYTASGQLRSLTYPDGAVADYVRDAQGRIVEIGVTRSGGLREVLLNQAGYAPFGPVTGWVYGNGRNLTRAYNQNYQPTAIQDTAMGGLDLGFNFDAVGNLIQLTPAMNPAPVASYDYDTLNRLIAIRDQPSDAVLYSYVYDKTGNRTSAGSALGTQVYTYPADSHRLTQVGASIRLYDDAGNTTAIGAKGFGYGAANRLTSVTNGTVVVRRYAYNDRGEQVRRQTDSSDSYAVYDETGHWLGEYASDGTAVQQAIWLDDMPVGLLSDNQLHYVEPDHLGAPRVVIDPVRNVAVWTWSLKDEAFGDSAPNTDPDGDGTQFVFDLRFPGQRYDSATGLNYNYFRDYDPGTGRYVQSDPLGLDSDDSLYAYVKSSPASFIDLAGLQPTSPGLPATYPGIRTPPIVFPSPIYPGSPENGRYESADPWGRGTAADGSTPRDWGRPVGRAGRNGDWCVMKCKAEEIGVSGRGRTQGACKCPDFIYGLGLGSNAAEAWNNAWDAANNNTPLGCMKKHCSGLAGSCRGWQGGKRK